MQKNGNHNKQSLRPQCNRVRIRKLTQKHTASGKLNNWLLNVDWIHNEMKAEIKIFFKINENKDPTYQNLWNTSKAVSREKYTTINADIKSKKKSKIDTVSSKREIDRRQDKKKLKT